MSTKGAHSGPGSWLSGCSRAMQGPAPDVMMLEHSATSGLRDRPCLGCLCRQRGAGHGGPGRAAAAVQGHHARPRVAVQDHPEGRMVRPAPWQPRTRGRGCPGPCMLDERHSRSCMHVTAVMSHHRLQQAQQQLFRMRPSAAPAASSSHAACCSGVLCALTLPDCSDTWPCMMPTHVLRVSAPSVPDQAGCSCGHHTSSRCVAASCNRCCHCLPRMERLAGSA